MAEVVLTNVSKIYAGGVCAVDQVNLTIADREFVVLVGPSGCGKSTTLRMIAGLEEISAGTIAIGARVVNDVPAKDRDIAMVFQNYALYPHMTVYKNMAFGLKLRGYPKAEIDQRVRWAAGVLGLNEYLDRKPKALSGGQRQRVAVGRAIVRQPKAFLFDEPLSNLDAKLRVETRGELKRLHQRLQTTTIYVTHDQEEAMTLGDRVVVMDRAKVQQVDAPLQVYRRPVNRFVAGFLGTPPMNFIAGKLKREAERTFFVGGGWTLGLTPAQEGCLDGAISGEVVLGVRPESLSLRPSGPWSVPVRLQVNVVEPLGSHMDIIGQTVEGVRVIARVPSEAPPRMDSTIELHLHTPAIHIFESGPYGRNLTLASISDAVLATH